MNWGRGLLRLWLVASVLWVFAVSYGTGLLSEWSKLQRMDKLSSVLEANIDLGKPFTNAEGRTFSVPQMREDLSTIEERRPEIVSSLKTSALLAILPPFGLLVFALLTSWVARGFRRD